MSGQSANLSISEAKAMMARTEACKPVDKHAGPKHTATNNEHMKKHEHQGK